MKLVIFHNMLSTIRFRFIISRYCRFDIICSHVEEMKDISSKIIQLSSVSQTNPNSSSLLIHSSFSVLDVGCPCCVCRYTSLILFTHRLSLMTSFVAPTLQCLCFFLNASNCENLALNAISGPSTLWLKIKFQIFECLKSRFRDSDGVFYPFSLVLDIPTIPSYYIRHSLAESRGDIFFHSDGFMLFLVFLEF